MIGIPYYIDDDGSKDDKALHDGILSEGGGYSPEVIAFVKELARACGLTDDEVEGLGYE